MNKAKKNCANVDCQNITDNDYFDEERKLTFCNECLEEIEKQEPFDISC